MRGRLLPLDRLYDYGSEDDDGRALRLPSNKPPIRAFPRACLYETILEKLALHSFRPEGL